MINGLFVAFWNNLDDMTRHARIQRRIRRSNNGIGNS
jgi:hypothetical protein